MKGAPRAPGLVFIKSSSAVNNLISSVVFLARFMSLDPAIEKALDSTEFERAKRAASLQYQPGDSHDHVLWKHRSSRL
jgi:hypothetical protein